MCSWSHEDPTGELTELNKANHLARAQLPSQKNKPNKRKVPDADLDDVAELGIDFDPLGSSDEDEDEAPTR